MVIVIKRIIILILLSFIIIPDMALAQGWWSHDYNERAEYALAENGQTDRDENYVYFINLTGLSGKMQNCTRGIRATDMMGNEIKSLVFNEFFSDSAAGFCLALIKPGQKLSKGNNLSMIFYYNSYNEIDTNYSLNLTTPTLLHDDKFLTNGTWTLGDSSLITNRVYGKEGYELVGHNLINSQSPAEGYGDLGSIFLNVTYINSTKQKWGYYADWANVSCENALRNTDGTCYYGQRFWWRGAFNKTYFLTHDNIFHLVSIAINGCIGCGDYKARIQEISGINNEYQSPIDVKCQNGVSCWKQILVKGDFSINGVSDISYVGGVFFDLTNWNITVIKIKQESLNNSSIFIISFSLPQTLQPNQDFHIYSNVKDISNTPVANLSSSDFKLFRDSEQINFTNFRNFNNGTYSLNASSGNSIGNISFRVEINGASAENFSHITIEPKDNIIFIASNWDDIFSSGLTGKAVFTNHSDTEKYYLGKIRPEQVFVFDNIITDYPTYKFKNRRAFLEVFYTNDTAITVSSREHAIAAAPYARLKNYPILLDNDEAVKGFNNIVNFSAKIPDEITDIAIKEFSKAGKNINTIAITNPNAESSALAAAVAAKHNSIIIPMDFSSVSYPGSVSDFYGLNGANGVMRIRAKINETIKKLSDNFLFSNSIDYKIGRTQLNLILLGNVSEVPQPVVFDSGREMFFDYDGNYLLTDFPYSDTNGDGKADLIAGRIVSPYQLIEMPKTNMIITAALYRNFETIFSGNGLIESQTTDAAFRTAGFETARLVENRTSLSYYELTFGLNNITDFLKRLFEEQSIMESLKLMDSIYSGYSEFLEHSYYKMMNSMSLGWGGITIKMIPDERLTKESLLNGMQNADGIFYYGKGDANSWMLESFGDDMIYFSEFPETSSLIFDERTNSARIPEKTVFGKGATAFIGSTGIIYDTYSFVPNAKFVQNIARNKSVALSLENSRYPLLPNQIRNLTAALRFNYQPERDISIKQFLQTVCYCDPEKKIDPDAQESGSNPIINHSATFISRIRIPINYIAAGDKLFFDAKDYLQEMGKPVIPLYSAETVLPNGSKIIGIGFDYNTTKYGNISADFIPFDEHFNESGGTVHGFYPSQMFYNETFELLDGRKTVRLIVAGVQYNNDTKEALVLDGTEAIIEYSSPFEFLGFFAENITLDMNQTFKINALGTQNLSVVIDIRSGNFSETVTRNISSGYSEIAWPPPFAGEFSATAYVLMGNNSAGPRYAYFSVGGKTEFFRIFEYFGNGYEKIMNNFAEKIRLAFDGASAVIEHVNPFSRFSSSANNSRVEKSISSAGYSFSVAQNSGKAIYKMKSDKGELVLEKDAGATKESCRGDCSELYAKMDSRLAEMQKLQDYIVENIR